MIGDSEDRPNGAVASWREIADVRRMSLAHRIRIREVRLLSDDWYELKKTTFDWLRADGTWQTVSRETYDRGNGATLLPYNLRNRTVVLTRQFRYPAFVNGYDDTLIETAAGLLDEASPEARIRSEVEEETGYRLRDVRKVFECFMSPGSVTERLHFFVGEYDADMRVADGGGVASEGEEIQVLELPFDEAMAMVESGAIADAKTIMLLQYAALHLFR
jgi:nudix-type nucleoside diphosphatase (YffH/AdpP family)